MFSKGDLVIRCTQYGVTEGIVEDVNEMCDEYVIDWGNMPERYTQYDIVREGVRRFDKANMCPNCRYRLLALMERCPSWEFVSRKERHESRIATDHT